MNRLGSVKGWLLSRAALGLGVAFACLACAESVAPYPRLALADREEGRLARAPAPPKEPPLIDETFANGWADWRVVDEPLRPFERLGTLAVAEGSRDGARYVTLSGERGALFRIVSVEPSTAYRFEAQVRPRGLVPTTDPFFGARPWLAELTEDGTVEELLQDVESIIVQRHMFATSLDDSDWTTRVKYFRTTPETRALLVACTLTLSHTLSAGEVDYRRVLFEPISDHEYRKSLLESARAEFARGEPDPVGWRAERRVRAWLGAELRPSIVLFPGESLTFELELSSGEPVLETGLGPWRPALEDALIAGASRRQSFAIRVDGVELSTVDREAPGALVETRWHDVSVALRSFAGETVEIELAVEGDLPGVFGAPSVRDAEFRSERPNLILVSIDTLRFDRLGIYGYPEPTSPRIDELARESIRFENAFSQAPYTLPSHASMFTGQMPSVHGIQKGGNVLSAERSPILARLLSQHGYRTLALTGGGFLNPDFGFDKGFDAFIPIDPLRHRESSYLRKLVEQDPDRFSNAILRENGMESVHAFLSENRDVPFFLFLHTYTVHDYDPPPAYDRCAERGCTYGRTDWRQFRLMPRRDGYPEPEPASDDDRAHLSHRYDDALRYVDHELGRLFDDVSALGLDGRTILVVTTDHGEEMLERGFVQHGKTLYEEVTRIPLILRVPGETPRVETRPAMTVDLLPTLLRRMAIPFDGFVQGVDLLAPGEEARATWSEIHDTFVHKYTIRDDGWKLIHSPPDDELLFPSQKEFELYDLEQDRHELNDLADSERARFEALRGELEEHRETLQKLGASLEDVGSGDVDPETLKQLEALGYL